MTYAELCEGGTYAYDRDITFRVLSITARSAAAEVLPVSAEGVVKFRRDYQADHCIWLATDNLDGLRRIDK